MPSYFLLIIAYDIQLFSCPWNIQSDFLQYWSCETLPLGTPGTVVDDYRYF